MRSPRMGHVFNITRCHNRKLTNGLRIIMFERMTVLLSVAAIIITLVIYVLHPPIHVL